MSTPAQFTMPSMEEVLKNGSSNDDDLDDLDESLFGAVNKNSFEIHESQRVPSSDGLTFPQWFKKYANGLPPNSFLKNFQERTLKDKSMPLKGSLKDYHFHFVKRRGQPKNGKLVKALEKVYALYLPFKSWLLSYNSNNEDIKEFKSWATKNAGFPDTGTYDNYKEYLVSMQADPLTVKRLVVVYKVYNRFEKFIQNFDFMKDHISEVKPRLSRDAQQSQTESDLRTGFDLPETSETAQDDVKDSNNFETGFQVDDKFNDDMFDDDDDMYEDDDMYGDDSDSDYGPDAEENNNKVDDFYRNDDNDDFFDDI
eukprot:UC4_evm3s754